MTDETQPAPRITRIEVTGLFGLYDHIIALNLEDRVTILHGPNGVGKTVLLKMIRAVLSAELRDLAEIPFRRFQLDFSSGPAIDLRAEVTTSEATARATRTLNDAAQENELLGAYESRTTYPEAAIFVAAGLPGSLARQFPQLRWRPSFESAHPWGRRRLPRVHLIEDQRILRRLGNTTSDLHPAVWGDAIDLQRRIAALARAYLDTAQALDQSFPTRLVQRTGQTVPLDRLKSRMSALETLRATLHHHGILNEPHVDPFDIASLDALSPAQHEVMALVVGDNEKKLDIFTDLLRRVELFLRIVNSRFRNKTLRADHRHGLVVVDQHGQPLELRALSSGEQQQIVLFYDLLFRAEPGSLVLLDEPELSWHLRWQKRFLPDLLEIVQLASIDVLVATHSPFIVGDRSDLMVALDAEVDHEGA